MNFSQSISSSCTLCYTSTFTHYWVKKLGQYYNLCFGELFDNDEEYWLNFPDGQHGMIGTILGAVWVVEDSTLVRLELLVHVDRHCHLKWKMIIGAQNNRRSLLAQSKIKNTGPALWTALLRSASFFEATCRTRLRLATWQNMLFYIFTGMWLYHHHISWAEKIKTYHAIIMWSFNHVIIDYVIMSSCSYAIQQFCES